MQTTTSTFNSHLNGEIRPLSWAYRMSFDKSYDDSTVFFTLDQSMLNGSDILAPTSDNPIQAWDFYKYQNYTDRIMSMEWTRELEFPYSVSSAMADITMNNFDNYFTPKSGSPIQDYIVPKRPLRILTGFNNESLSQFVGLTEKMPTITDSDKTVKFHAIDFLSQMYELETSELLAMRDVRTDDVLAAIFTQFGLASPMYSLDAGINVIPFLFYEKGTSAVSIMRSLMEAEMGNLWLDESGIIRFSNRNSTTASPVFTFDSSNIISASIPDKDNIINKVKINSSIRELQDFQSIYSTSTGGGVETIIKAGSTAVANITLTDPCISVTSPTLGVQTTTSWFTAIKTSDDSDISSGITVTGQSLKANSISLFFSNSNGFEVKINGLELWGEPAKVIDTIEYVEVKQSSIDKYDEQVLEISNNFIQSIDQCQSLALPILLYQGEYANKIEISVKSNPALQLNDIITVDYAPYSGTYKITKIISKLNASNYTQVLTCVSTAILGIFTLDQSILDGNDILGI